ncbi:hypothetical protein BN59_00352 [Legionella massiliensis]|uniref:Uncharacterized protein n=1 Tax=Legionella massiliensis TaxID=1034943 RepID=A0A078KWK6_9GAMM|nr:hypothetical protein [Legionella massiliensis]CDZ76088.1 hypothetical protein BN59_00352 [Legionella massiliensis]CEE11826.1 hypothetical protein BN1094_00352 [Legionella massiliensis]
MPFNMTLNTIQKTKKWTFVKTEQASQLQALLDVGDRHGYGHRLIELSKPEAGSHMFTRTKGMIYELIDQDETIDVPVKFQVKNSVITWAFIAPMDVTHQSFRDLVFNTAAKAHACVKNSCETYYRGTNHYHLRVMHSFAGESEFNHNHYRTANNGPITPVEVYEHLMAFYAQTEGRQFIPTERERNEIILKYAMYWADYDADISYVVLSLMSVGGGVEAVDYQLESIAKLGTLTPEQADKKLDEFFASEHGKNILKLAEAYGLESQNLDEAQEYIKCRYREIFLKAAPEIAREAYLDPSLEPHGVSLSTSSSPKSSPREEYETGQDQQLDEIDELEFHAFADELTKHCQSIDKKLLQDLSLDDFRKGLTLYHTLRTAQKNLELEPLDGQRFHSDFNMELAIREMISQLPALQTGSTEDSLGAPLLNKLVEWVKNSPVELDAWVDWVKVNGSRGLGSEIALVRQANGDVDLRQAIPQGDRKPGEKIAEIDFDNVDLKKIFMPNDEEEIFVAPMVEQAVVDLAEEKVTRLRQELGDELNRLVRNQQSGEHRLDRSIFQDKVAVITQALSVLEGSSDINNLEEAVNSNQHWDYVSMPGLRSRLQEQVECLLEMFKPAVEYRSSSSPSS